VDSEAAVEEKKLYFSVGGAGTLECKCNYDAKQEAPTAPILDPAAAEQCENTKVESVVVCPKCRSCECPKATCNCGITLNPTPIIPLHEGKLIPPGQCYQHCESAKCSALFEVKGWDTWYQCVQGCFHHCYTVADP